MKWGLLVLFGCLIATCFAADMLKRYNKIVDNNFEDARWCLEVKEKAENDFIKFETQERPRWLVDIRHYSVQSKDKIPFCLESVFNGFEAVEVESSSWEYHTFEMKPNPEKERGVTITPCYATTGVGCKI